jgi:hypothetical protein
MVKVEKVERRHYEIITIVRYVKGGKFFNKEEQCIKGMIRR